MQFYEVMEFFLRSDNASIWSQIQDLAQKGDTATLRKFVAEAQRLTSPFRVVRYPTHNAKVEGKQVGPENVLVVNIVSRIQERIS